MKKPNVNVQVTTNAKTWSVIEWAKEVANLIMEEVWDKDELAYYMRQIITKKIIPGLPTLTRTKQIALVTVMMTGAITERWDGALRWYPSTTPYCCALYRTVEKILKKGGDIWLYIEPEDPKDGKPILMNQCGDLSDKLNRAGALSRDIPRNMDIENEIIRSLYTTKMWTEDGEEFYGVLF